MPTSEWEREVSKLLLVIVQHVNAEPLGPLRLYQTGVNLTPIIESADREPAKGGESDG